MNITNVFFNKWQPKLVSILIAIGLFFYVNGIKNSERVINIPLVKTNKPNFLVAVKPLPKYVKVKITGPMSKISLIDPANIKATLDMRTAKYGKNIFYVSLKYDNYYNDVSVEKIDDEIRRRIDFLRTKIVPLSITTVNKAHKYYQLSSIEIEPKQVKIFGPKSVIDKMNRIIIKPINIDGVRKSFSEQVKADFKGANVSIKDKQPIVVQIKIDMLIQTKIFKNVDVRPINLSEKLDIADNRLPKVTIRIRGAAKLVDKIDEDDIKTIVNFSRIRHTGRYTLPVRSTISTSSVAIKVVPKWVVINVVND